MESKHNLLLVLRTCLALNATNGLINTQIGALAEKTGDADVLEASTKTDAKCEQVKQWLNAQIAAVEAVGS